MGNYDKKVEKYKCRVCGQVTIQEPKLCEKCGGRWTCDPYDGPEPALAEEHLRK